MPRKFDTMKEAFREMTRIADNETAGSTRREFIRAVKKFERAYGDWRALIPEQDKLDDAPPTLVLMLPMEAVVRTVFEPDFDDLLAPPPDMRQLPPPKKSRARRPDAG